MQFVLFAGVADVLGALIPFIVAIIWILNQVFGRLAQQPRNPPRNPVPPQPRPMQGPAPRPAAGVNDEIENFLRRAAQQRAGQQQRPQPAQPTKQNAPPTRRITSHEDFVGGRGQREQLDSLVEVELVDDEPRVKDSVSAHVSSYLDTRDFQKRASKLTSVDTADEAMAEHLQHAFQHKMGQLAGNVQPVTAELDKQLATAKPAAPKTPASSLAAMLRNPQNVRNAVILQEIFTRPADRW